MRSCHARAYGQWLQVKTTSVARAPPGECSVPSVSGSVKVGASVPMSVLIDGSWWSSRCGGRRARRPGPERERYGRRGDGRRGRSGPMARRPGPGRRRRRCGSWASRRSARGRPGGRCRPRARGPGRDRARARSSPHAAPRAPAGATGSRPRTAARPVVASSPGRLGDGRGRPSAERRSRSRGGAPRRPGHEHLFVRSPLYSDPSVPTEIAPTMENMLSSHPDLDAIYSISDTQTFGAVKAITAVDKDPIVVSFDAQPEALKDIKAGTVIDASVGQFPFKVGALAVKTAVAVAQGKSVDKQVISPLVMVYKTNVDKFTADQRQLP